MLEVLFYITLIFLVLVIGFVFYKKRKKKLDWMEQINHRKIFILYIKNNSILRISLKHKL